MPSVCLALETSSATCSVALAVDGETIEDTRALGRTHNEHLLGMIDGLCQRAGISAQRIDTLAYSAGPGSFTGVRIAASAAMAIALASQARLLAVNSLLALAASAVYNAQQQDRRTFLALRRSRKDAYYLAAYRIDEGGLVEMLPARLVTGRPELPTLAPGSHAGLAGVSVDAPWWLVGDEWPWEADKAVDVTATGVTPSADTLIRMLADRRFADYFESPGSASGLPMYVGGAQGGDHPWRFVSQ